MAKIVSPFVGSARGKLGGAVFYTRPGGTYARQRVVQVANPQTDQQLVTRVLLSTVSKAYSILRPICDHSFQNIVGKSLNQQEFQRLNINRLRNKLNAAGEGMYALGNFNVKGDDQMLFNDYIVSRGDLPSITPLVNLLGVGWEVGATAIPTYQEILDAFGLEVGAQLTFIALCGDETAQRITNIRYARVILDPADGDLTHPLFDAEGAIIAPNEKNQGTDMFEFGMDNTYLFANLKANFLNGESILAGTIITSYWGGIAWRRSNSELVISSDLDAGTFDLATAVNSYKVGQNSSLYLNGSNSSVQ